MGAQNIIDLGFDVDKLDNQKRKILSDLKEVFTDVAKMSDTRIELKFADSSLEIKKTIQKLKGDYDAVNTSVNKYNSNILASADATNKAAEANNQNAESLQRVKTAMDSVNNTKSTGQNTSNSSGSDNSSTDQNTTSTQQNTSAKQENTSATASNTSANKENAQSAYESAQAFRAGMDEVVYNVGAYQQLQRQLTAVREEIKQVSTIQASSGEELANKRDRIAELTVKEKELQATMRTTSQLINAQIKDNVAAEGSYDQLQAVLLQMDRTFKQLSATERSSETGTILLKNMQSVDEELKKIDASMGVYRRNVGNYASAVSGAFSMTFTRTVHAGTEAVMGMSRGVNALAIDLPNLIQEFMDMSNAQKQAKASGGEYLTTMQLLKAAFNPWTIVLQLGIMLLVKHGAEMWNWVTGAEAAKKKAEELKKAQEELNTAYKGSMETSAQSIAKLKELATTAANTNLQMSTRLAAVKAMKQEYPALLKNYSDEDLLSQQFANTLKDKLIPQLWAAARARALGATIETYAKQDLDNTKAVTDRTLEATKAQQAYNAAVSARQKAVDRGDAGVGIQGYALTEERALKNLQKAREAENAARLKWSAGQVAANKLLDQQQKELEKAGNAATDFVTTGSGKTKDTSSEYNKDIEAQRAANEKKLQLQAEYYKSISDLEIANIDARQSALDKWNDIEKKIITDNQKYKLSEKKLSDGEIQKINQEAVTALWKQDNAYAKAGLQVWTSYLANRQRVLTELNKQQAELTTSINNSPVEGNTMPTRSTITDSLYKNYEERLKVITDSLSVENSTIDKKYQERKINVDEFNKEMLDAQIAATKDQLKATNSLLAGFSEIGITPNGSKGTDEQKKQVDDLTVSIANLEAQLAKLNRTKTDNFTNKIISAFENIKELVSSATQIMSSINDIGYDNQITEITNLEAAQQKRYEKEVTQINNSTLSETNKANKLKILESERQAQSEANDRKQKKAEAEKAKFDKAMNIATATANFAVAISKTFAMGGFTPWAVAQTVALAAVQGATLAKIIATKIPEYAEGTDNHPGGPAIVGEGKNKELVQMPGGKSFIADKPMMMNLPKSTKVLPLDEKVFSLYANNASDYLSNGVISMTERSQAMDQAQNWNIAKWQVKQMEKMYGRNNQNIINRVSTKVDFGWMSYVNSKVFGKNKRA